MGFAILKIHFVEKAFRSSLGSVCHKIPIIRVEYITQHSQKKLTIIILKSSLPNASFHRRGLIPGSYQNTLVNELVLLEICFSVQTVEKYQYILLAIIIHFITSAQFKFDLDSPMGTQQIHVVAYSGLGIHYHKLFVTFGRST